MVFFFSSFPTYPRAGWESEQDGTMPRGTVTWGLGFEFAGGLVYITLGRLAAEQLGMKVDPQK